MLAPTYFLDCDHPEVRAYAQRAAAGATTPLERAVKVFYAVRDGIRYDPYQVLRERAQYRASALTTASRAFCIPKAILVAAACRALGIPSRLGFADVRNHLSSEKLIAHLGTDLFVFHGYADLYLEGRWVKATPAFNIELCEKFGVAPLDFDGRSDALFHEYETDGRRHMEYVNDRGLYDDFPFDGMIAAFVEHYGGSEHLLGDHDAAFHED